MAEQITAAPAAENTTMLPVSPPVRRSPDGVLAVYDHRYLAHTSGGTFRPWRVVWTPEHWVRHGMGQPLPEQAVAGWSLLHQAGER